MKRFALLSILFTLLTANAYAQGKQFLYIEFTPADATLEINGEIQETQNGVFEKLIPLGVYKYRIYKDGYNEINSAIIMVNRNETYRVFTQLEATHVYGSLIIKSTPSNQDIFIDGSYMGATPKYIPEIIVGEHKVEVFGITHIVNIEEGVESELIASPATTELLTNTDNITISDQIDIIDDDIKVNEQEIIIMDYREEVVEEVVEEAIPFQLVEEKPSFNGGDANLFSKWVNQKLVYPEIAKENGVQGRITLQFTVEKDGSITNVKVLRGLADPNYKEQLAEANRKLANATSEEEILKIQATIAQIQGAVALNNEAIRVVSSSPKWTPGKQRERAVPVTYTFPVIFQLR